MIAPDRALLLALAAETAKARARLDALAGRAADWVGVLPVDQRAAAVTEMQAFDALAQRLDVVAGLLAGLGRGEDPGALIAATPLAGMAARLGGREIEHPAAPGDLVLFD